MGDGAEGLQPGAEGGPGGFRGVVEVIEVDDFVFDEEVQLPAEEAAEVLVDEIIKGIPGGVVGEMFVEEGAVFFLFGGALGGEFEEGAFGAFLQDAGGGVGVEVGLFLVLGGGGVGEGES